MASLGLRLNPAKSKLLIVELGKPKPLQPPLIINGGEVEEVSSLRYLGAHLCKRLDFEKMWTRIAAQTKAALGALSRLVSGEARIVRFLYRERVESVLRFHLAGTPPATKRAWEKICSMTAYASRLITGVWTEKGQKKLVPGKVVMELAGLTPPPLLAAQVASQMVYSCKFGGRRYGMWAKQERADSEKGGGRATRAFTRFRWEPPPTSRLCFDQLQARRALLFWNCMASQMEPLKANGTIKGPKSYWKAAMAVLPITKTKDMSLYYLAGFA